MAELTEERVREIIREEIADYMQDLAIRKLDTLIKLNAQDKEWLRVKNLST